MRITGIIWLGDIVAKLRKKHSVEPDEVRQVLVSSPKFCFVEKGHRRGENVYSAMGRTDEGRYLTVFFVRKQDGKALILSARDMKRSERKRYGKK